MSKTTPTITSKVPFRYKVAFGVMLANQMFPASLGIFMVVLVQNLGFPGWMWGIVYFLPRISDALTDPIMGFISDNTKSKWGRRRQYVILGGVIMAIAFAIMWQLYGENSVNYNFTYFLLFSFAFYIGLTIFSVPYVAIGYEMSDDFHERTQIMAIAQWIGQWAWVIAPWFWVIMYDPDWFPTAEGATRQLAVWVAVVFGFCALVPGLFIPSKSTLGENYSPLTFNAIGSSLKKILRGFIEAFSSKPFRQLCISTFLIYNAFMTISGFSFFIIVWYLYKGDAGAAGYWTPLFGSAGAIVTTFIVIPIVAKMSKTMGKKKAFMISQGISIIGYASLWFLFVPGKPWMFLFALPFHSFGIGSLFTLMMSMTADVIDLDELNYGVRREGVFGAIYWYMVKFGFAIAGGASGIILTVVGFDGNLDVQPDGAINGLRLFFSGLPIIGTLIALVVMRDYDVTEERSNEIQAELARIKATKKSTANFIRNKLQTLDEKFKGVPLIDLSNKSDSEMRALVTDRLNKGVHGLCFSPYEENQQLGDILSREQIRRRIEIVKPSTSWVRSFSCSDGNELIPEVAHELGLKTMAGAWISRDHKKSQQEIDTLVKLAEKGSVDIAVVGNEVLLREDLKENEIINYILKVRSVIPSHIPVGYVDAYYQFIERPALIDACDLVLANCYPFWEGINNDVAAFSVQRMYELTKEKAKGKRVIITETGWPGKGGQVGDALPSEENAMKFFINIQKWATDKDVELFYFTSFDEPWKVSYEGEVGGQWGLWNKNEILKYQ
jgi:GPH family glycoside/pentoside/hexuronide:cation symporter